MNPQPKPRHGALERAEKRKRHEQDAATIRRVVRQRDGHRCRLCARSVIPGAVHPEYRAEVHHIVARSQSRAKKLDPDNLVTLCALCHLKVTTHELQVAGYDAATFRRIA